MNAFFCTLWILFVWVISFINPSGAAIAMGIDKLSVWIIYFFGAVLYLKKAKGYLPYSKKNNWFLVLAFIILPFLLHGSIEGLTYLSSFIVVYITSKMNLSPRALFYSALGVAAGGLGVLFVYVYGSFLSGWNDNAIAMDGLFSFIFFSIYLNLVKGKWKFWVWSSVAILYLFLMFQTACRSAALTICLAVMAVVFRNKVVVWMEKKRFNQILINLPLLIALTTIIISQTAYYQALNTWSELNFDKSIFNGRDSIWSDSLELLFKSNLLGVGEMKINYHNSGIACLATFGVLGYYAWVQYFKRILTFIKPYMRDAVIYGAVSAFCLIFFQQSFDLGFISPNPNYLPYLILGLAFSRLRNIYYRKQTQS